MRLSKKALMIGMLAIGLTLGGSVAAQAGTTLLGYNFALPNFQGPGYPASQTKAITNQAGYMQLGNIGGGYNANAKQCKVTSSGGTVTLSGCGSTVTNIYNYGYVNTPQTAAAGTVSALQMWINSVNFVSVQVSGYWASN
jgi:hypothetical protein